MKLRVAGAQIPVNNDDVQANVATIERAIEYAAEEKADILLTPEGSLSGYHHRIDPAVVRDALREVTAKAAERKVGLALGTCFVEDDGLCYNQLRFYERDGQFLGYHTKTLNCGTMTDPPKGEIEHYSVKPLRTFTFNGITIGGLICNDMWANPACTPMPDPHLTHQLALQGAKIILHAVNGDRNESHNSQVLMRSYHESNLWLRSLVDRLWIVTVDNAYPTQIPNSCAGGVINPQGGWAVQAPLIGENYFVYEIAL